jgi:hypothetical protein
VNCTIFHSTPIIYESSNSSTFSPTLTTCLLLQPTKEACLLMMLSAFSCDGASGWCKVFVYSSGLSQHHFLLIASPPSYEPTFLVLCISCSYLLLLLITTTLNNILWQLQMSDFVAIAFLYEC